MPITLTGDTGVESPGYSQGGDPVVESGSNSDGEWTRWADGTQICTQRLNQSGQWNYPLPFLAGSNVTPVVSARNNVARFASSDGVSTTDLQTYGWSTGGATSTPIDMLALGRWK